MILKIFHFFTLTVFAIASPVIDKLALARSFGPLKNVVSLLFWTLTLSVFKLICVFKFNPGKVQIRFLPGQTNEVNNFVSFHCTEKQFIRFKANKQGLAVADCQRP